MKKLKKIPHFNNESEEAEFWAKHDSTEYIDWTKAKRVIFPNLKATSKHISVRCPVSLIERIKFLANKRDVAYQSLIKLFLESCVEKELHAHR